MEGALRKGCNWKVPVILFTRPRRFGKTLALDMLKTFLKKLMRHDELFTSDSLNPVEQDYLSRMQSDELSDVEYTRALLNLGRMLEKHHQSKVVILIDEYDTPIRQGHSRSFYNEVITFMRNFMSGGLKDKTAGCGIYCR